MAATEERIRKLVDSNLQIEGRAAGQELNLDASVADTGVSSVAIVAFVKLVGEEFNVELPPEDVAQMSSLRDLINYIDAKSG